jgi:hypothetical protein
MRLRLVQRKTYKFMKWTGSGLDLLNQPLLGRVGAQLEVPLLAEPLERALQVSTIYFVATTESTQSDVLKPRAN